MNEQSQEPKRKMQRRVEKGGGFQKRLGVVSKDRVGRFELEVASPPYPIPSHETATESALPLHSPPSHKEFISQYQAYPIYPGPIQAITRKSALAKWASGQEAQTWM